MCMHNFSKQYFKDYTSKVLKPDYYSTILTPNGFGTMLIKQEPMDSTESFKKNKISFFDVENLFLCLENKYRINMFFIDTEKIDNIDEAYDVFASKISEMRKNFSNTTNSKGQHKMTQTKITYKQILETSKKFLINDPELCLNEQEVVPTASLSHDLGMDSLDKIQLLMCLEQQLNISIDDEEIITRKTGNLAEFCLAIQEQISKPIIKQKNIQTQKTNFLQYIKQRLVRQK